MTRRPLAHRMLWLSPWVTAGVGPDPARALAGRGFRGKTGFRLRQGPWSSDALRRRRMPHDQMISEDDVACFALRLMRSLPAVHSEGADEERRRTSCAGNAAKGPPVCCEKSPFSMPVSSLSLFDFSFKIYMKVWGLLNPQGSGFALSGPILSYMFLKERLDKNEEDCFYTLNHHNPSQPPHGIQTTDMG